MGNDSDVSACRRPMPTAELRRPSRPRSHAHVRVSVPTPAEDKPPVPRSRPRERAGPALAAVFAPPVEGHPGLGVREFPLAPGATLTRRASVLGRLGVPAEMGTLAPERAWH